MHLAIDLGASSGRAILGTAKDSKEIARFQYPFYENVDGVFWPLNEIVDSVRAAISEALIGHEVSSVGINSWAVDYVDLNTANLLRCYRDPKNVPASEELNELLGFDYLYSRNGLQYLPFNTVYQLYRQSVEQGGNVIEPLLLPDYLNYLFTGVKLAEVTNASTTGLVNPETRQWDQELISRLPMKLTLPPLVEPGNIIGQGLGEFSNLTFINVASHDTASAFVGAEAGDDNILVSSGTWSLIGVNSDSPRITNEARDAGFTNELGYGNSVRFLKNINGMWVLEQLRNTWGITQQDLHDLIQRASEVAQQEAIDINDSRLMAAGDHQAVLNELYGDEVERVVTVRRVLDSLASAYGRVFKELEEIQGRQYDAVKIVGGGVNNKTLNSIIENRTGKRVITGSPETTSRGNLLVQERALN